MRCCRMNKEVCLDNPKSAVLPVAALFWGRAGVIPFAVLASALLFGTSDVSTFARQLIVPYGAIILTFMGGIHWGLAMCRCEIGTWPFTIGVCPSLVAVLALVLPYQLAVLTLGIGFIALLVVDFLIVARDYLPNWYGRMRLQLTLAVVVCLAAAGFAA